MESELKKTKNWFRCVGVVNELDLHLEDVDIKTKDADGKDDSVIHGQRVRGKVSVKCNDGIHDFQCYFSSHNTKPDKNGNYDNQRWTMATSMLEWNPVIGGNKEEPATLVNIEGTIDINDYVGQDGEVHSGVRMNISRANTKVSADDVQGCSWNGVMFIKAIHPETVNDEETGRLVVDLVGVNSKSEAFPVKGIVEEDLADDFESCFEAEQTVNMDIDVIVKHIGQKKTAKKSFGHGGAVDVNSGFDITEYVIVGADDPIEEPEDEDEDGNIINNGWLNPKSIKKGLRERETKLAELKANGNITEKRGNADLKAEKQKRMAKTKNHVEEPYEDEDDPF